MGRTTIYRRDFMKYSGLGLAGLAIPGVTAAGTRGQRIDSESNTFHRIYEKVCNTPFIDTHEHLYNESVRLKAGRMMGTKDEPWAYYANDWSHLFSHYFSDDLGAAGLDRPNWEKIFKTSETDFLEKWDLMEPYWPYAKYTGYGSYVRLTIKELYGIEEVNRETIPALQQAYKDLIRPGFYKKVIHEIAGIESCQVNHWPFLESEHPGLLYSDLDVSGMIRMDAGLDRKTGISVSSLEEWHGVIDYYFDTFGSRAIAVKVANAYSRNIDFKRTEAGTVEGFFKVKLAGKPLEPGQQKMLEDHLFWYCVDRATEMNLPVKLHTGYFAGYDRLNLNWISGNPAAAGDLCQQSPETRFVFFHIAYPYYEEMIALAKNYSNATIDMCWSWIVNPVASKDFLKKFIMTAPLNKVTVFGGDFFAVELIAGHARMARIGIAMALSELVTESWIGMDDALWMSGVLMHENASKLYHH